MINRNRGKGYSGKSRLTAYCLSFRAQGKLVKKVIKTGELGKQRLQTLWGLYYSMEALKIVSVPQCFCQTKPKLLGLAFIFHNLTPLYSLIPYHLFYVPVNLH